MKGDHNVTGAKIFGSRAKGNYNTTSDIDIAIFGKVGMLPTEKIRTELEELPVPFHFDVVEYGTVKNPALRKHIDRVGKTIYVSKQGAEDTVQVEVRE